MEPSTMNKNQTHEETLVITEEEVQQLKQSLPKVPYMGSKLQMTKFQGFWCPANLNLNKILNFQRHFHARDTDLIIASLPKTGTTWLKSLLFAVANRAPHHHHQPNQISPSSSSPLLAHHPHELVHRLETVYGETFGPPRPNHLDELNSPRLLHTHLPYASLPESITASSCKILYVSRNPLDTFVSQWHFYPNVIRKQMGEDDFKLPRIEDYFEDCYQGRVPYGPFFDHVVGYWKQSLIRADKVLFLKYEELKEDITFQLKRLADFIGMPFSPEEESEGSIKEIIELCSISNMKELDVNKSGVLNKYFEKKTFFRKGEVGDWTNYFNPTMAERTNKLMEEKLKGTGLSFKLLP